MRNNFPNVIAFVLLAVGITAGWWYIDKTFFPPPPPPPPDPTEPLRVIPREVAATLSGTIAVSLPPLSATRPYTTLPVPEPVAPKVAEKPAAPTPAAEQGEPHALIALGDDRFFLKVLLTTQGGGVQQVVVQPFPQANRLGLRDLAPDGSTRPLHLIPGYLRPLGKSLKDEPEHIDLQANWSEESFAKGDKPGPVAHAEKLSRPSYALMHYLSKDDHARPRDAEGRVRVEDERFPVATLADRHWKVAKISQPASTGGDDEANPWEVVFETELDAPYFVKIRKTYTLNPRDFDFQLHVDVEALPGRVKEVGPFQYQLSGPVGIPIEGEWYTYTYRNAYVGWLDYKGNPRRSFDDAASIQIKAGGEKILKADNQFCYAAIATQYFASALAIDGETDPWSYVRAIREDLPTDPEEKLGTPYENNRRFMYDISFAAVAAPLDLAPGQTVRHDYAVYNGPVKVRLLKQLSGEREVADEVVARYRERYHLDTMTDYHSPHFFGRVANFLWWSDIIIASTNLMHGVLGRLHSVVGNWGLSIMLLTVLVRLCLILPSRRQQMITVQMQAKIATIKPDLEKIQEKYKDDFLRQQQEKAVLFKKAGISHVGQLGGCLLLFLQMPIFMGLYFCLQESVFFRLQEFLWIPNLAAPDMLVWWSEDIPLISSTANRFGEFSFVYLGPFFNILPVFAVSLFWVQQKLTMPPPTSDMEEQQRKMMKYMLIVTAFFFYKVAAGLCLYFIISGLWTLLERSLIPKPKPKPFDPDAANTNGGTGPGDENRTPGLFARLQKKMQERVEEMQRQAEGQRQIINNPQNQPPRPSAADKAQQRKNKKKKK